MRIRLRRWLFPADSLSYDLYFGLGFGNPTVRQISAEDFGKSVLVLAPHQDDEALGCGGLIIALAAMAETRVVFMTAGRGRDGVRLEQEQAALATRRMEEARVASQRMGIEPPSTLGLTSGDLVDIDATAKRLETLIETCAPDTILAPFLTDGHREHVATSRALARVEASVLAGLKIVLYQVHTQLPDRFVTDVFSLTSTLQTAKEHALQAYASQHLNRDLTRKKYLLLSKKIPRHARLPDVSSIERYFFTDAETLRSLEQEIPFDELVPELKSINYSPYSFKNYLSNRRAFALHGLR